MYDMKYGSIDAGKTEKSDRPEFQEAYKADVIQANAYLDKLTITKDQQKSSTTTATSFQAAPKPSLRLVLPSFICTLNPGTTRTLTSYSLDWWPW